MVRKQSIDYEQGFCLLIPDWLGLVSFFFFYHLDPVNSEMKPGVGKMLPGPISVTMFRWQLHNFMKV